MAPKKPAKSSHEVPQWVVTFGDMMALLLCFFILLQMFSQLKEDREYQRVITAIKEAFGYSGGIGVLPIDDPPVRSIVEQLENMAVKQYEGAKSSQSPVESLEGAFTRVKKVRDGLMFTIGGPASFDELSAEIKPSVRRELDKLAVLLDGRNNKILVRGHAAAKYLPDSSPWQDLDDLSYHRARNVLAVLVDLGLEDRVFRVEAVGAREPFRPRAHETAEAAENRRVEVILTEQLVEEANTDADFTDPNLARGG
ncbi:MAG: OmpA/MotB family protein [Planctomycetota bacterium]|jgi:chemotaxis protein MotB